MILWRTGTLSPWRASFRYRVALPLLYLEKLGVRSSARSHRPVLSLRSVEAIVFSKAFQLEDLALARRAHRMGVPILYDLCDNVFVSDYPSRARVVFEQIAQIATLIVTTNSALAELIAQRAGAADKVVVIPDSVETPQDVAAIVRRFQAASRLELLWRIAHLGSRALRFLAQTPARRWLREGGKKFRSAWREHALRARLVLADLGFRGAQRVPTEAPLPRTDGGERVVTWFGNHGGEHADHGMLDVLMAAPALERISKRLPVRLRIISNDRGKYARHIAPLSLPTEYLEWHPTAVHGQIRQSDVVVLPSTLNEFTRCKSSNRPLLALHSGVPVVATRTPANSTLQDCVIFDDWERGIESYLSDPQLRQAHLARAGQLIEQSYSARAVARQWRDAIDLAKRRAPKAAHGGAPGAPVLVLLLHLVQDLELILPLYRGALQRAGWQVELWVTSHDLFKLPEMAKRLEALRIPIHVVDADLGRDGYPRRSVAALVSASESTADPHLPAHRVTRWARRGGARTYTMQHGFQNVGLTWGYERFPVERVRFASEVIFLWGTLDSLDPGVRPETRRKCVPAGCPKPPEGFAHALPVTVTAPLVGIFENLHSARYTDAYRQRFLEDLRATALERSDLQFLLKPHPAGQWLTSRYRGSLTLPGNVTIADPRSPEWMHITAADMLMRCSAVITGVTTVAFDAARIGKPVAVAAAEYRMDLSPFRPLTMLRSPEDWRSFLRAAIDDRDPALIELSRSFSRRMLIEGDAVGRILERIGKDLGLVPA